MTISSEKSVDRSGQSGGGGCGPARAPVALLEGASSVGMGVATVVVRLLVRGMALEATSLG